MSKLVKFEFTGLDSLASDIKATFNLILQDQKVIAEVAQMIIKDIQYQTRRGVSAIDGSKFKPLSMSWIKMRKRIVSPTHPTFNPTRSNLTISGQLLESIKYESKGQGRIRFYFDGDHEPYKITGVKGNKKGQSLTIGKKMPNEKLAGYVEAQGRPFFGVRKSLEPRISKILVAAIRRNYKLVSKLYKK